MTYAVIVTLVLAINLGLLVIAVAGNHDLAKENRRLKAKVAAVTLTPVSVNPGVRFISPERRRPTQAGPRVDTTWPAS